MLGFIFFSSHPKSIGTPASSGFRATSTVWSDESEKQKLAEILTRPGGPGLPRFRTCLYLLLWTSNALGKHKVNCHWPVAGSLRSVSFCLISSVHAISQAIPNFMLQTAGSQPNCSHLPRRTSLIQETQTESVIPRTPSRSKHRRFKNSPSKPKRIELADIPDEVISKILECYILITKSTPAHIRLLNKRLAVLALPFALHTISLSSPASLSNLILHPESPLYNPYLGIHVQCLEFCYVPRTFEHLEVDNKMTDSLPNLGTIRFKFSMGVLVKPGLKIHPFISQDVLLTSTRFPSDAFFPRLLSQLHPERFEWVSPESDHLYLVGVYPMFRSLFNAWGTLSYIYLEGICLIEQPNLISWRVLLLANRVHIKAPFSKAGPTFLEGLQKMRDSDLCALLLLEESSPENIVLHNETAYHGLGDIPVLTYGTTMVSLKHWSTANRQRLKSRVVGRSSQATCTQKPLTLEKPSARRGPPLLVWLLLPLLFFVAGLSLIRFPLTEISKGTSIFRHSGFLWMICRDGAYLAEAICASETSLWFPDRSLMLHPT